MKNQLLIQLQKSLGDFNPASAQDKIKLLKDLSKEKLSAKDLKVLRQLLLFMLAYPQNEDTQNAALSEMNRISQLTLKKESLRRRLVNSGFTHTKTESAFSLGLTLWLCKTFPGTVKIHSFGEGGVHPKEILKNYLDESEFELTADEKLKPGPWTFKAAGTRNKALALVWLTEAFQSIQAGELIKDSLFESVKLFIEITPREKFFSSDHGKIKTSKPFYHQDALLKKFDEKDQISKPLPVEKKLSVEEKNEIISAARISLILLHRETDPITYCVEQNLKYFELGRGLFIALFSIDASRRLPLESYIGFMMFKNGYPMSYGGAWLFGKRALIGINIFEAFRGGESALVFANLLRSYKMAFGAEYFEVEPYQFGKNNPEGIKSGAFWFYHRFGFRPLDKTLFYLCEQEQARIVQDKTYRSPYDTLKRFTHSNLFAFFGNSANVPLNPAQISRYISRVITRKFAGHRDKASHYAIRALKQNNIFAGNSLGLKKLALFFAFCIDLKALNQSEKRVLQKMLVAKASDEFEYIRLCAAFSFEKRMAPEFQDFLRI